MYSGKFNLNIWLRSFIRADLVDVYEERCLEIVNKYEGQNSVRVLMEMFADLDRELIYLGSSVLKSHDPNKDENTEGSGKESVCSGRIFDEPPEKAKIGDVWIDKGKV